MRYQDVRRSGTFPEKMQVSECATGCKHKPRFVIIKLMPPWKFHLLLNYVQTKQDTYKWQEKCWKEGELQALIVQTLTDAYMMSVHVVDAMKLEPYWEQRFWTYVIAILLSRNIFLQQWVQMSIRISNWRLEAHPPLISTHETFTSCSRQCFVYTFALWLHTFHNRSAAVKHNAGKI